MEFHSDRPFPVPLFVLISFSAVASLHACRERFMQFRCKGQSDGLLQYLVWRPTGACIL